MSDTDRPNIALVVVDAQNGVVEHAFERDAVIATIGRLVESARGAGAPVIWVQHRSDEIIEGTHGWEFVPELTPLESELVVHKRYGDSFEDTDLENELARRRVGTVVVTGAQTDACIRATLHGAFVRGYETTLVSDAHTTEDFSDYGLPPANEVIAHTNMYWTWQAAPGRTGVVLLAADVDFGS